LALAFSTVVKNSGEDLGDSHYEADEIFEILGILANRYGEERGILSRIMPV